MINAIEFEKLVLPSIRLRTYAFPNLHLRTFASELVLPSYTTNRKRTPTIASEPPAKRTNPQTHRRHKRLTTWIEWQKALLPVNHTRTPVMVTNVPRQIDFSSLNNLNCGSHSRRKARRDHWCWNVYLFNSFSQRTSPTSVCTVHK